ncbi:hypothetical protein V475_08820 [Sphingobium baderi LL03]|uniref:Aminotransferase class I/classII domain-containing protein n=1 Tax=Sphingobium baderi LL03 TaxID=1114964 RepID=T0HRF7_9SPHN|nr:hypothetical protein L485_09635 [Sphingobium baderi LL03]KMS62320.1 hypothetical protein V475_08820 [Sphingobium baderi LL03]
MSAAAIAIGTAAYRDRDWISRMRLRLTAEAVSLDTVLSEAGLRPIGACPLFRLVETDNAQALFETLAARAILTRPFIENPRWLRFGLPADENAFVRLKEALVHG